MPYPEQALTAVLYLMWALLMMQLGHVLGRTLGMVGVAETLAWCVLAGGAVSAVIGVLQHYAFSTPLDFMVGRKGGPAVYGNLGQPNHYAAHLTLALAGAGYLYGCGRLAGALAAPGAALLLLLMALSGSRSPWLYLGALAALAVFLERCRRDAGSRRLAVYAVWLLPGFLAAQWVVALPLLQPEGGVQISLQRLFGTATGIEARLQLLYEAWRLFLEAPLLGAGFGQFAWHHYAWSPPPDVAAAPGLFSHAHNIVLQLLAESGLAGAVLVAAAALYWLAGLRRVAFDRERWWLLATLSVVAIHSGVEFPLWYAYFLGIAAVLLGVGATQVIALSFAMTRALRLAAVAVLAIGWFYVAAIVAPYRDFERLVFDARPDARPEDERAYADAIMRVHREPLLRPYVELAMTYAITVSAQDLRQKLDLNTRVMRFAPVAEVVYRQASLLALAGERAAALRQLDQAARAYPRELDDAAAQLRSAAARQPGAFLPLLELAAARSAELRARGGAR